MSSVMVFRPLLNSLQRCDTKSCSEAMNLYPIDLLYMGYVIQNLVPLSEDA